MKNYLLLSLVMLLSIFPALGAQSSQPVPGAKWGTPIAVPYRGEVPLREGEKYLGRAFIKPSKEVVKQGESFTVDLRFTNHGPYQFFCNPFFDALIPRPAELAVYDAKKRYVTDLIALRGGSMRMYVAGDWHPLPSGDSFGTHLSARVDLSPGTYYLQVVYWKAFTAPLPPGFYGMNPSHPASGTAIGKLIGQEIFRSNVVQIHVQPGVTHEGKRPFS